MILEIFDSYRRGTGQQWREKHDWIYLAQVCRKWRAIVFGSSFRLDLGITVGPVKPGHIKTILSYHLPIFINCRNIWGDITASALWRMRSALKHAGGVREIAFSGTSNNFDRIFKETKCAFPNLETLHLDFGRGRQKLLNPELLDFFLGPDLSNPHLRSLRLCGVSLASISGFLLSATSLTGVTLRISTSFAPSFERFFLAHFQGLTCLRSLDLTVVPRLPHFESEPPSQPSAPKGVPLSKLTYFRYFGPSGFLNALVAGISASSLRDVRIQFDGAIRPPIMHLPQFINEIQKTYHAVHVDFKFRKYVFRLSLLTRPEYVSHCNPRLILDSRNCSPESIIQMSAALSVKLTTVEYLHVNFDSTPAVVWENSMLWRRFYQQFPSVKVLRTEGANNTFRLARTLPQDYGEPLDLAFLPALKEIDLGKKPLTYRGQWDDYPLSTFQKFVSARRQEGRPVKVFFQCILD